MQPSVIHILPPDNMYVSDQSEQRAREVYGQNSERLAELKAKYDPTNLFRLNRDIKATA